MWKYWDAFRYNVLILLILIFYSCELLDSKEVVPSYLNIKHFKVSLPLNDYETYGSKSNKITDAWIYINDNLLGAFELPFTIPILEKGVSKILIRPGIKNNGIFTDRIIYPHYNNFEQLINFKEDSSYSFVPNIEYNKNLSIWKDNFDGTGLRFFPKNEQSGSINFITDSAVIFHEIGETNKASAKLEFSDSSGKCEILSLPVDVSNMADPIFLELNYLTNYPLAIGVYKDEPSLGKKFYKIVLKENKSVDSFGSWNKIYIDLTEHTKGSTTGKFSLFFESNRKEKVLKEEIFIDNVKILGRTI